MHTDRGILPRKTLKHLSLFHFLDVISSVKIHAEKRLQHERQTREVVELELEKFREYCAAQERRIAYLKDVLCRHGITIQAVKPFAGETIRVLAEVSSVPES